MKVGEVEILQDINNIAIKYIPQNVKFNFVQAKESVTDLVPVKTYLPYKKKIVLKTEKFIKRAADIIGGIVGAMFLLPLTIFVYIANFISGDRGPVFYKHTRIGKDGSYFKMYKYRSMCMNAEEKLKKILDEDPDLKKQWEQNHKLEDDPRITKVGKFLRKTSLDEFPQFINVIKGEMSLVGPRAVVDGEIDKFGVNKYKVLSVKPGVTGYWAANGRSCTSYEERVEMEATYVDQFSLLLDIKLLFKTFVSVIKKEGAI